MNTMRTSLLVCTIVAFATVASAQGQGRGQGQRPKPELTAWWNQPIVRDLGLSDEQNRQIRAIVAESRDRLIQLRGAVDSAEGVLRDAMDEEKVDTRRAEAAIEKVVATHAEMMRAVSQMSLKLRVILTSAQWQELEKRESQPPPPAPGQPQKKKEPVDYRPAPLHFPDESGTRLVSRLFAGPDR
jgi:Spy/CpxP family protein refolding chaperone